jgi:hypothetical protein
MNKHAELLIVRQAIQDYRGGQPLSDQQLKISVKHLKPLICSLRVLDDRFALMTNELDRVLMQFEDFIEVRKRKTRLAKLANNVIEKKSQKSKR